MVSVLLPESRTSDLQVFVLASFEQLVLCIVTLSHVLVPVGAVDEGPVSDKQAVSDNQPAYQAGDDNQAADEDNNPLGVDWGGDSDGSGSEADSTTSSASSHSEPTQPARAATTKACLWESQWASMSRGPPTPDRCAQRGRRRLRLATDASQKLELPFRD